MIVYASKPAIFYCNQGIKTWKSYDANFIMRCVINKTPKLIKTYPGSNKLFFPFCMIYVFFAVRQTGWNKSLYHHFYTLWYICVYVWAFNCLIIFWCLSACIMFLSLPPKVQGKLRIINLTPIACKRSCADTFSNFTSVLCWAFVTRKTTQTHTILELAMSFQGWTVKECATCPIPGQYPDILHAKIARGNKSCPCFSP